LWKILGSRKTGTLVIGGSDKVKGKGIYNIMEGRTGMKDGRWINVVERGIKNDGSYNVGPALQDIIDEIETDFCVLYFPKGKYLFTSGVKINKEIVLQGDSNSSTGTTQFITRGVENMSIITLSGTSQCIKNINFYYDSHDIEKIPPKNVSAITEYGETQGLSHFEHLFISGFSGIGIEIPYYSTGNDITVSSCGLGMRLGEKSMLSSSKIYECKNGMEITTGVSLNNVRIEEIKEIGINNKGFGFNLIMNLMVDQCGYCGFMFEKMCYSQITARITRCGQYYKSVDYNAYENMEDRKEEAYSIFYGDILENCNIVLMNSNIDTLENDSLDEHKIYVIKANETNNVMLTCYAEADNFIQCAKGNLLLENGENTYKFYNGEICSVGGVQISDIDEKDLIKIIENTVYIDDTGKYLMVPRLKKNTVIYSVLDSTEEINK
ncbi:glycoside hydrolase family 55 protein, partial [Clostridioides difficile]|nr:glycoside hydrolase family 55 protein [Clostridioides difficile]